MTNLKMTQPHFVRCIIPNEEKESGSPIAYTPTSNILQALSHDAIIQST